MASLAVFVAWIATAAVAPDAGTDIAAAGEAFSLAQRAELAHDYGRAAEFYELADSLAPSPEALRSAAKNRFAAGQLALAATAAAALVRRYPKSPTSRELAEAILADASRKLGLISVACDRPCVVSANDHAVASDRALSHSFYLEPGEHELVASFGPGRRQEETVRAKKGRQLDVTFTAPDAAHEQSPPAGSLRADVDADALDDSSDESTIDGPAPRERPLGRLSPVYFAVGAVATAGLVVTTAWSGADVRDQHRDYQAAPTSDDYDAGISAQRRTNVLIGVTAVVGAATVVLAVFTDWSRRRSKNGRNRRAAVGATAGGLEVRF